MIDFKARPFQTITTETGIVVPVINGDPTTLLCNLDGNWTFANEIRLSHYLVGTSGSGKTRTVFEALQRDYGFYFAAASDADQLGTNDFVKVYQELPSNLNTIAFDEREFNVRRGMNRLINCRMVLLKFARNLGYTPLEWLLLQLLKPQYFTAFLDFIPNDQNLATLLPIITNTELIVLDEAQEALAWKPNTFLKARRIEDEDYSKVRVLM